MLFFQEVGESLLLVHTADYDKDVRKMSEKSEGIKIRDRSGLRKVTE